MTGRAPAFRSPVLGAAVAAFLAALVYSNSLHNPFVYDDHVLVLNNPSLASVHDVRAIVLHSMMRPLTNFSYAIDRALWGLDPFGFHVTNVLLHVLNVVLLFSVAYLLSVDAQTAGGVDGTARRGSPGTVALTTAVLFGVHPLMTQAVGYISGRSELLCAACGLIAFLAARRWMRGSGTYWWGIAVLFWGLAVAAKEVAIVLPLVVLAYDRLLMPADRRARAQRGTLLLPFLAFAVVAAAVRARVLALEYPDARPAWRFALIELEVVRQYLAMLVLPRGQTIFHSTSAAAGAWDLRLLPSVAVAAGLSGLAWSMRRLDRVVALGIVWFALLIIPSSLLLVFVRGEPMSEHRVYFASMGILLAVGCVAGWMESWVRGRHAVVAGSACLAFGLVVFSLGSSTWQRNVIWSEPVGLWEEAVRAAPDNALPRVHLAEELRKTGRCEQAVDQYRRSIAFRPAVRFAYGGLGACLLTLGRFEEAGEVFVAFRDLDRQAPDAGLGLDFGEKLRHSPGEARQLVVEALDRHPSSLLAPQLLAVVDRP